MYETEESILERAKQKLILDHMIIQRMDTSGRTTNAQSKKNKYDNLPLHL
jgi:hypothetical protein